MDPVPYLVFRQPARIVRLVRELPDWYHFAYVGVWALWRGGQRDAARALLCWRLVCLFSGNPGWPRVLAVYRGSRIVHRSFVLPALGRIPGMRRQDLEISACWTEPEFRCRRLFQQTIQRICADLTGGERTFWMACREANHASAAAIVSSGFEFVGSASHIQGPTLFLHHYAMTERPVKVRVRRGSAAAMVRASGAEVRVPDLR